MSKHSAFTIWRVFLDKYVFWCLSSGLVYCAPQSGFPSKITDVCTMMCLCQNSETGQVCEAGKHKRYVAGTRQRLVLEYSVQNHLCTFSPSNTSVSQVERSL